MPRAVVPPPTVIALRSVTWIPVVPPAPPLRTTVAKSLVAVVRVMSFKAFAVTVPVDVIAAAWVIDPAVEVAFRT